MISRSCFLGLPSCANAMLEADIFWSKGGRHFSKQGKRSQTFHEFDILLCSKIESSAGHQRESKPNMFFSCSFAECWKSLPQTTHVCFWCAGTDLNFHQPQPRLIGFVSILCFPLESSNMLDFAKTQKHCFDFLFASRWQNFT